MIGYCCKTPLYHFFFFLAAAVATVGRFGNVASVGHFPLGYTRSTRSLPPLLALSLSPLPPSSHHPPFFGATLTDNAQSQL